MKKSLLLSGVLAGLALSSCGYHLGGLKPRYMADMNTFCVEMFENNTVQPSVGVYMTTTLTNAMQGDGTYRLAPRNEADFVIRGKITHITRESLTTNPDDSYISTQIGLTIHVKYELVNGKTGATIIAGEQEAQGAYFNQSGSTISGMESALFYAASRISDDIVLNLTTE